MKQLSRVTAGRVGSRYSLGSHSGARLFAQFLPQRLARTVELSSLSSDEQRILNQVSAHEYLSLFIIVEEFILPFLLDHAREAANEDAYALRALLN